LSQSAVGIKNTHVNHKFSACNMSNNGRSAVHVVKKENESKTRHNDK